MAVTIFCSNTVSLTAKETALFDAIADGMDEPGSGWLHELVDPSCSVSAVLGSLIRKGLVISSGNIAERGDPPVFWVELTAVGFAAVAAPAAPAAAPAGPCLPAIKPAAAPAAAPGAAPAAAPAAPGGPAAAPGAAAGLAAASDHEPNHDIGYQLTDRSDNKKTGAIPVSTTTRSSCSPTCIFAGNGCYAEAGGPLILHWAKVTDGRRGYSLDEFLARVAKLKPGQLWRHNQAGDLPHVAGRISRRFILGVVKANRGKRGFTFTHHKLTIGQNFRLLKFANRLGFRVNISTETEAAADAAVSLGLPAVMAVNSAESRAGWQTAGGNRVVVCPAQTRDDMDCKRCQLCHHRPPNLIVAFLAHGKSVKKANAAIGEVN